MSLPEIKKKKMTKRKKDMIFDALEENFALLVDTTDVESPLTTAYKMLHDPKTKDREKVQLLQFLAPYVHQKRAQLVEVEKNTNVNININKKEAIDKLDDYLFEQPMRDLEVELKDIVIEGEVIDEDEV